MFGFTSILAASSIVALSLATPLSFADSSCAICVDDVNDCGKRYGGCYDFCKEPRKEFDIPECNGVSGKKRVCEYTKSECGTPAGGCYPAEGPIPGWSAPKCPPKEQPDPPKEQPAPPKEEPALQCPPKEQPAPPKEEPAPADESCRICLDQINDCKQMYGGCYDFCAEPRKVFEIPECNGVSGKQRVCEYKKNDCGKVFGGCYPAEAPNPGWEEPECPAV